MHYAWDKIATSISYHRVLITWHQPKLQNIFLGKSLKFTPYCVTPIHFIFFGIVSLIQKKKGGFNDSIDPCP